MTIEEKKAAWRLLGESIDRAEAAGEPADRYLSRLALLLAMELPSLERFTELAGLAPTAGEASAGETADMRETLAQPW